MKALSKHIFTNNDEIMAISIAINPDIYMNIIDVLSEIGYTISNQMQKNQSKVINYIWYLL